MSDVHPIQEHVRKALEASPFKNDHHRSQEQRVRRAAARQGLLVKKSADGDRRALDYGVWYVVGPNNGSLFESTDLAAVEAYLKGDDE